MSPLESWALTGALVLLPVAILVVAWDHSPRLRAWASKPPVFRANGSPKPAHPAGRDRAPSPETYPIIHCKVNRGGW